MTNEDNISMPGDKQKRCYEVDVNCISNEVSTCQKRARDDDKHVSYNHSSQIEETSR